MNAMDPSTLPPPPDASNVGRIPKLPFQVVLGILFGIALVCAAARTAIRVRQHRRLHLDDGMLLLACAALVAGNTLVFVTDDALYLSELAILDPAVGRLEYARPSFADDTLRLQRALWAFTAMVWTTLFGVKVCFLLFFRHMVQRLGGLVTYWKVVLGLTLAFYVVCMCGNAIGCPHVGLDAGSTEPSTMAGAANG